MMKRDFETIAAGHHPPLGAVLTRSGVRFSLRAPQARLVELCLFEYANGQGETARVELTKDQHGVWQGVVPGAAAGQLYGYRVHGPYQPGRGLRFNPQKLLFDPYARAIIGQVTRHETTYGYRREQPMEPLVDDDDLLKVDRRHGSSLAIPDEADSAPWVPKSMVIDPQFDWSGDRRPQIPWRDTLIYECHVKGLTQLHPDVPPQHRGTYLGLTAPAVLDHLRQLGVTTLEVLPVHHAVDRERLHRIGLTNYWGYDTIGFFAPDARFASNPHGGQVQEFKTMVRDLHRAGFEVILDVVYNHTPEGDHLGPTLCLRGIDNAGYYLLDPMDPSRNLDFTGCGNTLNAAGPMGLQLIMDSLRYWVSEMHVDGFRFDLASAMLRTAHGLSWKQKIIEAIAADPVLASVKLIVEPWDAAEGGYQLGRYSRPFVEWNDKYRDAVRRFWIGTPGQIGEMASRLSGSSDVFQAADRGPLAGINFITSHDGFTLHDLTAYEHKNNQENGEDNRDGMDQNFSHNWGHEGPCSDTALLERRDQMARNLWATLAFSLGVPMITAGDEMGRTQLGNNNAYCQDNAVSWLDWNLDGRKTRLLHFARRVLDLRRRYDALRSESYFQGRRIADGDLKDLSWWREDGREMQTEDWYAPDRQVLGMMMGQEKTKEVKALLLLMNARKEPTAFRLPIISGPGAWSSVVDTGSPEMTSARRVSESMVLGAYHCLLLEYRTGE